MISRQSTKTIADAYYSRFTSLKSNRSRLRSRVFSSDSLYDFLYVNDFESCLLNAFNKIPSYSPRLLQEFIMQLHTGESLVSTTLQWSWQQRQMLGQRILKKLAECLIRQRLTDPNFETYGDDDKRAVDLMQQTLEIDGYIYRDNILWIPEETVIEEAEEQGVLEGLMTSLNLPDIPTLKHHLELSVQDYQESRWDDSISNSRKVLEGVLSQAAACYITISGGNGLSPKVLERPVEVRDYLEHAGILERKEKDTISSVYGLLSDTGGHPYIAERDQARLMRHLALTFSQFVLLRLEGILRAKAK
jgi:hypothetical protein